MDIINAVRGIPDIREVANIDNCWTWTGGGRYYYFIALNDDETCALQVSFRDQMNLPIAAHVLRCARKCDRETLRERPLLVKGCGFDPPFERFDCIAIASPEVHRYHQSERPDLHAVTYAAFPAFQCEFSGMETRQQASLRFQRMLDIVNLSRKPQPWVRMRYDNPKTGGGSIGPDLGLTTTDVFLRELKNLNGVEGGYIEIENYRGQVCRFAWQDGLRILGDGPERMLTLHEAQAWADVFFVSGGRDVMQLDVDQHPSVTAPSLADVRSALHRLTPNRSQFAILRSRPIHHFVQTHLAEGGLFALEYREGGPERHYEASEPQSLDTVLDVFCSYFNGDDRWRTMVEWQTMALPS